MEFLTGTAIKMRHVLVMVLLAGTLGVGIAPNAQAQGTSDWAFSVDIPLQFAFTGDINGTSSPSGFKAALELPFYVGVGTESYSVEANDPAGTAALTFDYEFTDFYVWYKFQVMTVAFGVGDGTVVLKPVDDGAGTITTTEEADADQNFLILGWLLNPNWEFHIAYHQIEAVANLLLNGVPDGTTVDLGGVMTSAGFKYMF